LKKETKKEVKKVTKKKTIKKEEKQTTKIDMTTFVTIGSLIVCTNSFSSDLLIEKIFVILGLVLMVVGLHYSIKEYKKKGNKTMRVICIILLIASLLAIGGLTTLLLI
jgi:membrane-associated HD superfamily phosphohydrolase